MKTFSAATLLLAAASSYVSATPLNFTARSFESQSLNSSALLLPRQANATALTLPRQANGTESAVVLPRQLNGTDDALTLPRQLNSTGILRVRSVALNQTELNVARSFGKC